MAKEGLSITMCAPADEDPYFAEISFETSEGSHVWAEMFLTNVNTSATGEGRVANASVVVRAYTGGAYVELSLDDAVGVLEAAKLRLLDGERRIPADQD